MIEFHVDDHELLQQIANEKFVEFGGALSVRKPENVKLLIVFGQDESAYNQFAFNGIQWVGPDRARSLLPKNNGIGKMVSAFQSRETGFGMEISKEDL